MKGYVHLQHYPNIHTAEMIKELLASHGVVCMIQRGNSGAAASFTGEVGDADLFVLKEDFDIACEILEIKPDGKKN